MYRGGPAIAEGVDGVMRDACGVEDDVNPPVVPFGAAISPPQPQPQPYLVCCTTPCAALSLASLPPASSVQPTWLATGIRLRLRVRGVRVRGTSAGRRDGGGGVEARGPRPGWGPGAWGPRRGPGGWGGVCGAARGERVGGPCPALSMCGDSTAPLSAPRQHSRLTCPCNPARPLPLLCCRAAGRGGCAAAGDLLGRSGLFSHSNWPKPSPLYIYQKVRACVTNFRVGEDEGVGEGG